MILKGRKIIEGENNYYIEFEMSRKEAMEFLMEVMIEHASNNTLVVKHDHANDKITEEERKAEQLLEIVKSQKDMDEDTRKGYYIEIKALLSKKVNTFENGTK